MKNNPQVKIITNQKINNPITYSNNFTKIKNEQSSRISHIGKKKVVSTESSRYFSPQKICYGTRLSENISSVKHQNKVPRNIEYIYESSELINGNLYGEKINEKKNYILYCSKLPQDTKDNQYKNIEKNYGKYATRSNFYEKENISNENYNYKEIKSFKYSCPEIKSVIQHQVFNTPLNLVTKRVINRVTNKNLDNNKKIFGSLPKKKMRPSFSTRDNLRKDEFFEKKYVTNQKMQNNQNMYSEKSDYCKIFTRKLPHVMSEKNLGNPKSKVETYTKSTKDCDYIIKVTTTFTELPNNNPGIKVETTTRTSQVYNSNERYKKNCNKNYSSAERINNNKYMIIKNGDEKSRIARCPVHGKKRYIYKKIS